MAMTEDQLDPDDVSRRLELMLPLPENSSIPTTGMVTLMVPSDGGPTGELPLELTLNGKRYVLPRNTMATVPRELAALILNGCGVSTPVFATEKNGKVVAKHNLGGDWESGEGVVQQNQSRFRVIVDRED